MFEQFPYVNFHDLNLDWIIQKVKEAYGPDNPPENVVISVNGEQGVVVLYKEAQIALPDVTDGTWNIYRGVGDNGKITGWQLQENGPGQRIDGTNRYNIYDEGNPPPYPVLSVNGQTGAVVISVPVQSVNGQTGHVILYQNAAVEFPQVDGDVWSIKRTSGPSEESTGIRFENGNPLKRIDGNDTYEIYDSDNEPPYPVTSVGSLTGAVVILDTSIVTDGGVQKIKIAFPVTSVDGQTGTVETWGYTNNAHVKLPIETALAQWGFYRDTAAGEIGVEFEVDNNALAGYITLDDGVNPITKLKILTPADIPSSSGVVSVNGQAGVVNLYGSYIPMASTISTTVKQAIDANRNSINTISKDFNNYAETGSTAAYNHPMGSVFTIDGVLYKALVNIVPTDTFTVNTNVEETTLNLLLDEINTNIAYYSKHTVSDATLVNLASYTTNAGAYTTQSDGYVYVQTGLQVNDETVVRVNNKFNVAAFCTRENYRNSTSLFVRKGMTLYTLAMIGSGYAYFYPLG